MRYMLSLAIVVLLALLVAACGATATAGTSPPAVRPAEIWLLLGEQRASPAPRR